MKPQANSIGVLKRRDPPHIVASQLKILTPVGTAMSMLVPAKMASEVRGQAHGEHVVRPDGEAQEADGHRA